MERSFAQSQINFINKTLLNMAVGLFITFLAAYGSSYLIGYTSYGLILIAAVAEIAIVIYLSARINKLSPSAARGWFFLYAALNGFTLSIIFMAYSINTISVVFLLTALMFLSSAMIGMNSKKDLTALGQFAMMLVIGLILATIMQLFLHLPGLNFMISIIGIIAFCGLTAYDMQKIKRFHMEAYSHGEVEVSRFVIIMALQLYLDFINLFLYVLRLFKDN